MKASNSRVIFVLALVVAACVPKKKQEYRMGVVGEPALQTPTMSSVTGPALVEVEFFGVIAHVKSGNIRRAVIVNDAAHEPLLTMPKVYKAQLEALFGASAVVCHESKPECTVPIKGMTLRVVGIDDAAPFSGYQKGPNYDDLVDGLYGMGVTNLHADVTNPFPSSNGPVAGWFELNGGEVTPTKLRCRAKFPSGNYKQFNKFLRLSLFTRTKPRLEVKKSAAGRWLQLPLNATRVQMRISNYPQNQADLTNPHFHLFGKLNDPEVAIPDPTPENSQDCINGVGTVPGCSNSQWP